MSPSTSISHHLPLHIGVWAAWYRGSSKALIRQAGSPLLPLPLPGQASLELHAPTALVQSLCSLSSQCGVHLYDVSPCTLANLDPA